MRTAGGEGKTLPLSSAAFIVPQEGKEHETFADSMHNFLHHYGN